MASATLFDFDELCATCALLLSLRTGLAAIKMVCQFGLPNYVYHGGSSAKLMNNTACLLAIELFSGYSFQRG